MILDMDVPPCFDSTSFMSSAYADLHITFLSSVFFRCFYNHRIFEYAGELDMG